MKNEISILTHEESAKAWPGHIQIVGVSSDSMSPALQLGDIVAVDTSQRKVSEGIYFLKIREALVIRRLGNPFCGSVDILCDNKLYSPEKAPIHAIEELIIGRVVLVERKL
jgi:phage repressor protein C with HTH and peptisase S24 domain